MNPSFLDFEQPIADLQAKIEELRLVGNDNDLNIGEEVARLQEKSKAQTKSIFANLTSWQIARMARHPQRPYTLDYLRLAFDEFDELAGDRAYADDKAIVVALRVLMVVLLWSLAIRKAVRLKRKSAVTSVCQHQKAIVKHCV